MTLRILLVEDNPTFLMAVRQFMDRAAGMRVVGLAHNGAQALALAAELQPDLVLLDMALPQMSGLEVARAMLAWPQPPRIVFLSMHDQAAYREAARDLGVQGFVGKADFVAALLPIIEKIMTDIAHAKGGSL